MGPNIRGFLSGSERNEEVYFAHSASLRIFGAIPDLDEISRSLSDFQPVRIDAANIELPRRNHIQLICGPIPLRWTKTSAFRSTSTRFGILSASTSNIF
jgi:hypothetical protein